MYGVESLNLKLVFYRSYHLRGQVRLDRGKIVPEVGTQIWKSPTFNEFWKAQLWDGESKPEMEFTILNR